MKQFVLKAMMAGAVVLAARSSYGQSAKYCGGPLVANSFYSNVLQTAGGGATVEYHVQLQNQDTQRRKMTVMVVDIPKYGTYTFVKKVSSFTLAAYEQKDIALATTRTTTSNGVGAPSPTQIGTVLRVTCSFQ